MLLLFNITSYDHTLIFRYAGILSAYGMALADVVHECQEPCASQYDEKTIQYLDGRIHTLSADCVGELMKQGFRRSGFYSLTILQKRPKDFHTNGLWYKLILL